MTGEGAAIMSSAGYAMMRASDGDRAQAQTRLNDAFAEGRLSRDEWDDRATLLASAVTYADLEHLTADLPIQGPNDLPRTNTLAVASLACGVGQLLFWLPAGVAAIILGHKAQRQIRRTGERGAGLAQAGLVLGYAGTIMMALVLVLVVVAGIVIFHWIGSPPHISVSPHR